ncbi:MAG TPA: hypothetical protein VGI83_03075, partial [Gemmatimonadales bacterium]
MAPISPTTIFRARLAITAALLLAIVLSALPRRSDRAVEGPVTATRATRHDVSLRLAGLVGEADSARD